MGEKERALRLEQMLSKSGAGSTGADEALLVRASLAARLARAIDEPTIAAARQRVSARINNRQDVAPAPRGAGRRRPVAALAFAAALLTMAIVPASRALIGRQLDRVLAVFSVGDHTSIVQSEPPTAAEAAARATQFDALRDAGHLWHIHTPYGGFAGEVPAGLPGAIQESVRLDEVHAEVPFTIRVLSGVYRGRPVEFRRAMVSPNDVVFLFFGEGEGELLLAQGPVGHGRAVSFSRTVSRSGSDGRITYESPAPQTEQLSISGQRLVWDPDTTGLSPNTSALRWEADEVSYSLYGRGLTREEAESLFLSLR